MSGRRSRRRRIPSTGPALLYQNDPIRQSVQRLGRKWTLLIVRDLAFLKLQRFGEFRRNNPGLSARVLSRRLRELEQDGIVTRSGSGATVRYRLTPRGEDAGLILLAFLNYGLKHHVGPRPPPVSEATVPGAEGPVGTTAGPRTQGTSHSLRGPRP
ncbi:MAG TPA: helix-turn-helix domain-containing protein [Thermoplasmata archaeon]|nr:helix-turn-helix domain-containing protein [Thermoplasmata archaeon]